MVFLSSSWIRKIKLTSHPGKQTIANISRRKGNQAMRFGQLIEYNTRNNVFEKSCTKYGEEAIPRPFFKKSKLSKSLDLKSYTVCFLGVFLVFFACHFFFCLSLCLIFYIIFKGKCFSYYILLIAQISLLREILGNMCIVIGF